MMGVMGMMGMIMAMIMAMIMMIPEYVETEGLRTGTLCLSPPCGVRGVSVPVPVPVGCYGISNGRQATAEARRV